MDYRGVDPVQMVWGEPRRRPFKGYWVRWFDWLQSAYPHQNHTLFNGGRDATPVQVLLPCLYAYVPPKVDLVFLELGSMLYHHAKDNGALEAVVRKLLALEPRPTIAFVTVPLWCKCRPFCRVSAPFGIKKLPNYSYTLLDDSHRATTHTESAVIERTLDAICQHYHLSCISLRSAIYPQVALGLPGFHPRDIAGDCLHPVHGKKGFDYITELLIHWSEQSSRAASTSAAGTTGSRPRMRGRSGRYALAGANDLPGRRQERALAGSPLEFSGHKAHRVERRLTKEASRGSKGAASLVAPLQLARELPPPLRPTAKHMATGSASCFGLEGLGSRGTSNGRNLLTVPWRTAHCPLFPAAEATATTSNAAALRGLPTAYRAQCTSVDLTAPCPKGQGKGGGWRGATLPVWVHCTHALGPNRKPSPGVLALQPGALLYLPLELAFVSATVDRKEISISLLHLTSYEGMGVARLR